LARFHLRVGLGAPEPRLRRGVAVAATPSGGRGCHSHAHLRAVR
jgi:hypothetical protein